MIFWKLELASFNEIILNSTFIKRGDETYRQGKTGPQQNGAQTDSAAGGRVIDFWFRFVVHGGLLAFGFHNFFLVSGVRPAAVLV